MRNDFSPIALAVMAGVAIGMFASLFGQKAINQHHLKTCGDKVNHTLVHTTGFLGDTYYCVHNKYL
jgi:uncharacterized membrane protein YgdD (TMEM256/DUF423 family)